MDWPIEHTAAPVSRIEDDLSGIEKLGLPDLVPGQAIHLGGDATRYELVRLLGRGGMGAVFLARKIGPAGFVREVALKCMTPGLDDSESFRRAFMNEARLASRLHHPNIAEAYDLAEVGDRFYLVFEYIEGVTAGTASGAARATGHRLSEGFCCHVGASVADALHYAHGLADADGHPLAIIHRDVSASNVMIASSGVAKLLDFGIARARLLGRDQTMTGKLKGTYSYMSPEQVLDEPLDGRSDLFSLGVLLVELATGRRIFDAGSEAATIHKISQCKPLDVRVATRELPRGLARTFEKALSKKPGDRFQDGAEFASALRGHLARRGVAYWSAECAAELRALGLLGASMPSAARGASDGAQPTVSRHSGAQTTSRRHRVAPSALLRAAVFSAIVAVPLSPILKDSGERGAEQKMTVGNQPALAVNQAPPPTTSEPMQPSAAAEALPAGGLVPDVEARPDVSEPVVRPKRAAGAARHSHAAQAQALPVNSRDRASGRIATAAFVDRPTVPTASATLAHGTLVPARLMRSIDVALPGKAEAVVTEDVVTDGTLLVPKGSTVVCTSRRSSDGRVPLSCDTIKAGDHQLSFQGVAVGDNQHIGLRVLDNEVAAGTAFVVYVNASAAVQ